MNFQFISRKKQDVVSVGDTFQTTLISGATALQEVIEVLEDGTFRSKLIKIVSPVPEGTTVYKRPHKRRQGR